MRRTRRLLLLAIAIIVAGVSVSYTVRRALQERNAPAAPARLPEQVSVQARAWTWKHVEGNLTRVAVTAQDYRQLADSQRIELRGLDLKVFDSKDQHQFSTITSAKADFDPASGLFYSEGDVEIVMGQRDDGKAAPPDKLMRIRSSGVKFEYKTERISTDRPTSFVFDRGEGRGTGAQYDSKTRELRLAKDVWLKWKGERAGEMPLEVTGGSLLYKEAESRVEITPWAKMVRGTFTLEGADSAVILKDERIDRLETKQARGSDQAPKRKSFYSADELWVLFADNGEVQGIAAQGNARLKSVTADGETLVSTNRLDTEFEPLPAGAVLKKAHATGAGVIESHPAQRSGPGAADSRLVRSEKIELTMRPGGEEIDNLQTHTPGTVEFLPNRPTGRKRTIDGERLWLTYGTGNAVRNFRAINVKTRTDGVRAQGKPPGPPAITSSQEMEATFDAKTGDLATVEQRLAFRYEEGDRRALADRAIFEQGPQTILLAGKARIWDPSGATAADRILLHQQTDAMEATGNVNSTRAGEQEKPGKKGASPMLSGKEPVQARAARMKSTQRNQVITYEGDAVLWQGSDRITADRIVIDRTAQRLEAQGKVTTQLLDRRAADAKTKAAPLFTSVRAERLLWTEKDSLAHYTGGVRLVRGSLEVESAELRAWIKDSSLDRAVADGKVRIEDRQPGVTRTGTGEHGEYYLAEERFVLTGGSPQMTDSVKGTTRGRKLTWYARNDRLLVEGAEAQPAVTTLRRK